MRTGGHRFRSSQGRRRSKRPRKIVRRGHIVHHNHRRYAGTRGGRNGLRARLRKARATRLRNAAKHPRKHPTVHRKRTLAHRRKATSLHKRHLKRHAIAHKHRVIHRKKGLHHRRRVLHAHRRHGYHLKHKRHLLHKIHRRKGLKHPHKGWHGHHVIHHPRKKKQATPAQHFLGYELAGSYTSMFGG